MVGLKSEIFAFIADKFTAENCCRTYGTPCICWSIHIIATYVFVCPNRAGHMVGPAGTVSELYAKMLFFLKTMLCERLDDRKI